MEKSYQFIISEELGASSAIHLENEQSTSILLLAHGAGAGMNHPFMQTLSESLLQAGIASLRYNFAYMERGSKRPDSPKKAKAAIKAALELCKQNSKLPIFLSGKSFGGRMSTQLLSEEEIDVKGIILFGFPLHAPGRDEIKRADHLQTVKVPMLFLQGTRDTLAKEDLMKTVCKSLELAELKFLQGADHSFKTLKRSGIKAEQIMEALVGNAKNWIANQL